MAETSMGFVFIPAARPPLRFTWLRPHAVPRGTRWLRIVQRLGSYLPWRALAAQAVLLAGAVATLFPALAHGVVPWEDDTRYFYYPLLSHVAAALRR